MTEKFFESINNHGKLILGIRPHPFHWHYPLKDINKDLRNINFSFFVDNGFKYRNKNKLASYFEILWDNTINKYYFFSLGRVEENKYFIYHKLDHRSKLMTEEETYDYILKIEKVKSYPLKIILEKYEKEIIDILADYKIKLI